MKALTRFKAVAPAVLALTGAELARRLLTPRAPVTEPAHVELEEYFSAEEIARGRAYARPQRALGIASSAVDLAVVAALVVRPPRWPALVSRRPVPGAMAVAALLSVGLTLPTLPLRALARRRSMAVGLDTQSWTAWASDVAKVTMIQLVLGAGAGAGVVAVMRRYRTAWWAPAAVGSVALGGALAALAPVVLDPIFNDFTPLPEGQTRRDVLELAEQAGVKVREVYSVDASRRTTAANAYVTGLGPTKRVVLFDTLLDRYSRDEIRLVVAHELAHVRHRDVPRNIAYATLSAPFSTLAVQQLSWSLSSERGTGAALPALLLSGALISAPLGLIGNRLSRAVERRADDFALGLAEAPEAFISFERAIALQNVADLNPPRWVSRLMATHPTTLERIGAAVAHARPRG